MSTVQTPAFIFGSYATGKTTGLSDLDTAILLRGKVCFEEKLDLIGDLYNVLNIDDFDLDLKIF